ncbi:DUF924 family protein [Sphingomonas sp.]|uniref:DUF924 family protein n=1 Tax=Sphingomonas sp. TaxID=28214 RepID=UPI0031DE4E45
MDGDLVAADGEVHVEAQEQAKLVLDFWFGELTAEQHFVKDDALDAMIRTRFATLHDVLLATGAAGWRNDPDSLLAAIIVLDQFSRNIHRGTPEAFAGDTLALALTMQAIDKGWDRDLPPERAAFLYMPLMHAENPEAQRLCIQKMAAIGLDEQVRYAMDHAVVIEQFGRFPTRNAALGRESTPEERVYLSQPGVGW